MVPPCKGNAPQKASDRSWAFETFPARSLFWHPGEADGVLPGWKGPWKTGKVSELSMRSKPVSWSIFWSWRQFRIPAYLPIVSKPLNITELYVISQLCFAILIDH